MLDGHQTGPTDRVPDMVPIAVRPPMNANWSPTDRPVMMLFWVAG